MVKNLLCEAVEYAYPGGERVVDGATLAVAAGSLTCIIGPNGAGKSTLLKGMAGLLSVDSGAVTVDGGPVGALEARVRARTLALVPQFLDAIPAVTVENFVLGGRYGHLDGWRRARRLPAQGDRGDGYRGIRSTSAHQPSTRRIADPLSHRRCDAAPTTLETQTKRSNAELGAMRRSREVEPVGSDLSERWSLAAWVTS